MSAIDTLNQSVTNLTTAVNNAITAGIGVGGQDNAILAVASQVNTLAQQLAGATPTPTPAPTPTP